MIILDAYYTTGYYLGALIFILLFAAVYWFVGRWGWIGRPEGVPGAFFTPVTT